MTPLLADNEQVNAEIGGNVRDTVIGGTFGWAATPNIAIKVALQWDRTKLQMNS